MFHYFPYFFLLVIVFPHASLNSIGTFYEIPQYTNQGPSGISELILSSLLTLHSFLSDLEISSDFDHIGVTIYSRASIRFPRCSVNFQHSAGKCLPLSSVEGDCSSLVCDVSQGRHFGHFRDI